MVITYSKNDCTACVGVKNLLANNGVEFEERNIEENDEYMDEVMKMGYASVPVTITKEGKEIVGFDLPELQQLIKDSK